jgi:hypothetical protein
MSRTSRVMRSVAIAIRGLPAVRIPRSAAPVVARRISGNGSDGDVTGALAVEGGIQQSRLSRCSSIGRSARASGTRSAATAFAAASSSSRLHIRAAYVSVLGGIQPGPVERYLRNVFGGRGMTG